MRRFVTHVGTLWLCCVEAGRLWARYRRPSDNFDVCRWAGVQTIGQSETTMHPRAQRFPSHNDSLRSYISIFHFYAFAPCCIELVFRFWGKLVLTYSVFSSCQLPQKAKFAAKLGWFCNSRRTRHCASLCLFKQSSDRATSGIGQSYTSLPCTFIIAA